MRWLRLAASAVGLAAWLAGSVAQQQGAPPAGTPPPSTPPAAGTPPARTPPAGTPQPAATPEQEKEDAPQQPAADVDEEEFIPTEELQPDAAVTFPVDI